MTKIKFGILGGVIASLITVSPSFGAISMLQGTSLDLQGTVNEDAVITFMNNGAEIRKDGSFNMETGDALKLVAGKSKGVIVEHNVLLFNDKTADVIKYGDPKIDFKQGGSVITAEGNGLGVESDGVVKLVGSNVRVDHNLLSFVNDPKYPIPTINFVKEGAKITAEDGVKIEGDKGLTISGPLTVTGTQTMTGNQHVTGTLQVDGASTLAAVSSAGAINFTGAITLGDGTSTVQVASTSWDVSTAGALTGVTGITMASGNFGQTGTGTFGTGTGAVSLNGAVTATGDVTMNDAGADTILIGAAADTVTLISNTLSLADDNWNVTAAGLANFVSVGAATAGTGAFTTLGSTGVTTIGNNSATVAVNSSDWDINATGDMTGIGALTADGAGTFVGVNSGAGLLQGALGLTVTGATVNLNASSNFGTNINTGTSTGTVAIGGTLGNTIGIGNDDTTADTISIGSLKDNVTIVGDAWNVTDAGLANFVSVGAASAGSGAFTTLTSSGALTNTGTSDIGWSVVASSAACNTTCTSACVFGQTASFAIVACTDATATTCVCAGGS